MEKRNSEDSEVFDTLISTVHSHIVNEEFYMEINNLRDFMDPKKSYMQETQINDEFLKEAKNVALMKTKKRPEINLEDECRDLRVLRSIKINEEVVKRNDYQPANRCIYNKAFLLFDSTLKMNQVFYSIYMIQFMEYLSEIHIKNISLKLEYTVRMLSLSIISLPSLKKLVISNCTFSKKILKKLAEQETADKSQQANYKQKKDDYLRPKQLEYLRNSILASSQLNTLTISNNKLKIEEIDTLFNVQNINILNALPNLKEINISYSQKPDNQDSSLGEASVNAAFNILTIIKGFPLMKEVHLSSHKAIGKINHLPFTDLINLTVLDLAYCDLGPNSIIFFIKNIDERNSLKKLILTGNHLGNFGMTNLIKNISNLRNLQELLLGKNEITEVLTAEKNTVPASLQSIVLDCNKFRTGNCETTLQNINHLFLNVLNISLKKCGFSLKCLEGIITKWKTNGKTILNLRENQSEFVDEMNEDDFKVFLKKNFRSLDRFKAIYLRNKNLKKVSGYLRSLEQSAKFY